MKFTSEQVSCGHPDKICDQISDAILTDCLRHDRNSRVAVECMIKDYEVLLAGEITTSYGPDYYTIVQSVLKRIGLPDTERYRITRLISRQSPDIAIGVDHGGAGDQGMMFGYATDETPEMLPMPFAIATRALELLRDLKCPILLPDAKSQVTYDYANGRIDTFLISTQHREDADMRDVCQVVRAIMEAAGHDPDRVLPVSTTDFLAARPADAPPMAERPAYSVLDNLALRAGGFAEMRDFREPLGEVVAALAAAG